MRFQKVLFVLFALCYPLLYGQTGLGYNLSKGDQFVITQQAEQQIEQQYGDTLHIITNIMGGHLDFKVKEIIKDTLFLQFSFESLHLSMSSNLQGELMNVNTNEGDSTQLEYQIFKSMLGMPLLMKMSSAGKIWAVTGGEAMIEHMTQAAGIEDPGSAELMRKMLDKDFGSDALAQSMEQMTFIYPDKPQGSAKQWKNSYDGKLKAENTWELLSQNSEGIAISGNADIIMDLQSGAIKMHLTGLQETEVTVQPETGIIQSMLVESFAEGAATKIYDQNDSIPTVIRSQVSYKLIDQKHVQ